MREKQFEGTAIPAPLKQGAHPRVCLFLSVPRRTRLPLTHSWIPLPPRLGLHEASGAGEGPTVSAAHELEQPRRNQGGVPGAAGGVAPHQVHPRLPAGPAPGGVGSSRRRRCSGATHCCGRLLCGQPAPAGLPLPRQTQPDPVSARAQPGIGSILLVKMRVSWRLILDCPSWAVATCRGTVRRGPPLVWLVAQHLWVCRGHHFASFLHRPAWHPTLRASPSGK